MIRHANPRRPGKLRQRPLDSARLFERRGACVGTDHHDARPVRLGTLVLLFDPPGKCPRGLLLDTRDSLRRVFQHPPQIGKALASRADTYRSKDAAEILKEAQRLSGVELVDPPVRNQFLSLLRVRIAPRVIALSMIESLSASGYRLALWGANWPAPAKGPDLRKGPIPVGEALARLFRESSVVLFPVSSPHWLQLALDALATGAAVAFRSPGNSLEEKYPMLADLSERLHVYASRNKLREMVRELTVNAGHESSELAGPQELMRSKHSVARRLEMMWHVIRERGGGQR